MRLVTLNTWKGDGEYSLRLADMAAGLAALRPDVVTLQEALVAPAAGHDTAGTLAARLNMAAAALPLRHKPRSVEGQTVRCTSGLAVLSRWPVSSQRQVPLTTDPSDGERPALIAELDVGGRAVTVACLHLTHLRDADELRRRQWHEVLAALPRDRPVVVAGDFNAPIEAFGLSGSGFEDAREACGEPVQSTVLGDDALVSYDHVLFATGRLKPVRWQIALREPHPGTARTPSDHAAVVVDFEWAAPGKTASLRGA